MLEKLQEVSIPPSCRRISASHDARRDVTCYVGVKGVVMCVVVPSAVHRQIQTVKERLHGGTLKQCADRFLPLIFEGKMDGAVTALFVLSAVFKVDLILRTLTF